MSNYGSKNGPKSPKDKKAPPQSEDAELWERVTRSVKAYARPPKAAQASSETPAKPPRLPKIKTPSARMVDNFRSVPAKPPVIKNPAPAIPSGFDRATEAKLKKGKLGLDGKIDLHGMTQEEAFRAVKRFILKCHAAERRTLLIITGKGSVTKKEGVLRRMLPLWLEDGDLRPLVLGLSQAQPRDGGGGAFYLRLRKKKAE